MVSRPILQEVLASIPGVKKAYFNPPESVKMIYPCIRYSLKDVDVKHANDLAYKTTKCYELILICEDPDNPIVDGIMSLPMCSFDRSYVADKLYHYVFTLYY